MKQALLLCLFAPLCACGQGIFDGHADIGHPKLPGSAIYDDASQTYTIHGAGSNIWFNRDEFQFVYKKLGGDFILTADFAFTGDTAGSIGHRKTGWMIRESLDEAAASYNAAKHIDGLTVLQWRPVKGAMMQDPEGEIFYPKKGCQTIQLERSGNVITMRVAGPGEPLQLVGSTTAELGDSVYTGLYVCSHDSNSVAEAKIWNVRIDRPVSRVYYPNPQVDKMHPQPAANHLQRVEDVDIADGRRLIGQGVQDSIEPKDTTGVTPDKRYVYYTSSSTGTNQIWRRKADGSDPGQLTFDEFHNWYPRVSPDGKWVVFMSFSPDIDPLHLPYIARGMIRLMPVSGGAPRVIVPFVQGGFDTLYKYCWSKDSRKVSIADYY